MLINLKDLFFAYSYMHCGPLDFKVLKSGPLVTLSCPSLVHVIRTRVGTVRAAVKGRTHTKAVRKGRPSYCSIDMQWVVTAFTIMIFNQVW